MKPALPKIFFASKNTGKIREIVEMLAPFNIRVLSPNEIVDWQDVAETGASFAANAILKSENGMLRTGLPTIADDSGLAVAALNGAPGVHSARFAAINAGSEIHGENIVNIKGNADDEHNNRLLLQKLDGVANRRAKYVCVIAFSEPEQMPRCFYGETAGEILTAPHGKNGFGYDPLFFSTELQQSFGDAAAADKHQISHRGRALRAFLQFLISQ